MCTVRLQDVLTRFDFLIGTLPQHKSGNWNWLQNTDVNATLSPGQEPQTNLDQK